MERCKICQEPLTHPRCISEIYGNNVVYKEMLVKCLSNLSNLIQDQDCICSNCQYHLENSFKFLNFCEENLPNARKENGVTVLYSGNMKNSSTQVIEQLKNGGKIEQKPQNTELFQKLDSNRDNLGASWPPFNNQELMTNFFKPEETKNRCVHCLKSFSTAKKLNHHIQLIQYPLTCKLCRSVLETRNQLNNHCKLENCLENPQQRVKQKRARSCRSASKSSRMRANNSTCRMCVKLMRRLRSTKNLFCQENPCKIMVAKEVVQVTKRGNTAKILKCGVCYKRFVTPEKFRIHSMMHISYYNNCRCSYCGVDLQQVLRRLSQVCL